MSRIPCRVLVILLLSVVPMSFYASTLAAQLGAPRPPVPGAPPGVTAFVDVTVIPMDTERVLPSQTVLVQHGWIIALGSADNLPVPAGAARIAGQGKYLMPGLGDCHAHISAELPSIFYPDHVRVLSADSVAERRLFTWLADGVTTIRNMDYMNRGDEWMLGGEDLLRLRASVAAGKLIGPRIYTAGQWAPHQYTHSSRSTTRPPLDSIPAYVAAYKAAGYNFIKVREESPEVFTAVLRAATKAGIPVVGHVPKHVPLERALAEGMHSIEHLTGYRVPYRPSDDTVSYTQNIAATRRAGVWNCVTIQAGHGTAFMARPVKALQDAGARLLLGTDQPLGRGIHQELELLVKKAGMTPYQALATGTQNMAAYFGTLNETGTVAVGKRADLVLLNGNPFEDIRNTRQPAGVMLGGRWLPRAELDRRLAAIAAGGGAELPGHKKWPSEEPLPSRP